MPLLPASDDGAKHLSSLPFHFVQVVAYPVFTRLVADSTHEDQEIPVGLTVGMVSCPGTKEDDIRPRLDLLYRLLYPIQQCLSVHVQMLLLESVVLDACAR